VLAALLLNLDAGPAPPPVLAPVPTLQGAGAPRRFVVPPEMAKAAQRLAGDNGVVEAFIAMLTVGIFNDHG
jgi:hypothetical protein